MDEENIVKFDGPSALSSIIKVIGVGGGGCNAVAHMADKGITGVDFVVMNTDRQALDKVAVENKILLGPETCKGLGAGAKPEKANAAAKESEAEIQGVLESPNTSMVFITAGMGGGTGTGAAPVVAKMAKDRDILTVGVVTVPFLFEGRRKISQALQGVENMKDCVDAMLVINNERLRDIHSDLEISNGFSKADDVLLSAVKGISEIITVHGHINVDFQDVRTTMTDGGVAIMNSGYGKGEQRLQAAIKDAINSPLLKDSDIHGAKHVLFVIYTKNDEQQVKMEEVAYLNDFMEEDVCNENVDVIWGLTFDDTLESGEVKITLIATGFNVDDLKMEAPKHPEPQKVQRNLFESVTQSVAQIVRPEPVQQEEPINTHLKPEEEKEKFAQYYGSTKTVVQEQNEKVNDLLSRTDDEEVVKHLENEPAYNRRQNIESKPYVPRNTNDNH